LTPFLFQFDQKMHLPALLTLLIFQTVQTAQTAQAKCQTGTTSGLANYNYNGITSPTTDPLTYRIIAQHPRNTSLYTQGLSVVSWGGKKVFLSSSGGVGKVGSGLGYTDIETGNVLHWKSSPGFGEGTTLLDGKIYQLTWQNCLGYIYNDDLERIGGWKYSSEGWGITTCKTCIEEERLVVSDGTDRLFYYNPLNMSSPTKIVHVTDFGRRGVSTNNGRWVGELNELEFVEGSIWSNVYTTNYIVITSPLGIVSNWVDFTGLVQQTDYEPGEERVPMDVFNGIAWDDEDARLYVTGKLWPRVFEVVVLKDGVVWAGDGVRPTVSGSVVSATGTSSSVVGAISTSRIGTVPSSGTSRYALSLFCFLMSLLFL
jgi:glutamine cyclotransferase